MTFHLICYNNFNWNILLSWQQAINKNKLRYEEELIWKNTQQKNLMIQ